MASPALKSTFVTFSKMRDLGIKVGFDLTYGCNDPGAVCYLCIETAANRVKATKASERAMTAPQGLWWMRKLPETCRPQFRI